MRLFLLIPFFVAVASAQIFAGDTVPPPVASETKANAAILYRQACGNLRPFSNADKALCHDIISKSSPLAPFPENRAATLLATYAEPLKLLKEATILPHCDWQYNYSKGIGIPNDHLKPLFQLSELLCIEIRLKIRQKDFSEAINAVRQFTALRDHLASEKPLAVELFVQVGVNSRLFRTLAQDLLLWPKESLASLKENLPPPGTTTFEKVLQTEAEQMTTTFERTILPSLLKMRGADPEKAKTLLHAYQADLSKITALLALPPAEALKGVAALQKQIENSNSPLSALSLGSIVGIVETLAENETFFALFHTAVDIRMHGPEAVEKSRDPSTGSPFLYQKDSNGFTLTSALKSSDQPLSLTFH